MSHTSRRLKNKLIEGQASASFLMNSSSCSFGKSESGYCQFGDLKQSLVIGHGSNNHGYSFTIFNGGDKIWVQHRRNGRIRLMNDEAYVFFPKSLTNLEIETGGLLTLDDINLLNTVLEKDDSVLLERNLKS